jgi:hypothetical protein
MTRRSRKHERGLVTYRYDSVFRRFLVRAQVGEPNSFAKSMAAMYCCAGHSLIFANRCLLGAYFSRVVAIGDDAEPAVNAAACPATASASGR